MKQMNSMRKRFYSLGPLLLSIEGLIRIILLHFISYYKIESEYTWEEIESFCMIWKAKKVYLLMHVKCAHVGFQWEQD